MHRYEVFKIFKLGKKAGKRSNHPLCEIDASSLDEATAAFKATPKWKSDMEFHIILKADVIVAPKVEANALAADWKVGELPWFQMHPTEEDAPFVQGEIKKILEQNDKKVYVVWVLGDYASWRYKTSDVFQRNAPKRRKVLPTITEEENESIDEQVA